MFSRGQSPQSYCIGAQLTCSRMRRRRCSAARAENSAPLERGRVLDLKVRKGNQTGRSRVLPGRDTLRRVLQLFQRHLRIKQPRIVGKAYRHAVRRDRQFIPLRRNRLHNLHLRRCLYVALAAGDGHFPRRRNQRNRRIPARRHCRYGNTSAKNADGTKPVPPGTEAGGRLSPTAASNTYTLLFFVFTTTFPVDA